MSATVAICVLGVVCLGLLAALLLRERQHDSERAALLDRIQSPEAARARAFQAAAGDGPLPEDVDRRVDEEHGRPVVFDDDLSLDGFFDGRPV